MKWTAPATAAALAGFTLFCASCTPGFSRPGASAPQDGDQQVLRLGYFPNLTHAPALLGIENRSIERELGPAAKLELQSFNAGPPVVEALFADALDAAYVGPAPAISAFSRSKGRAIRIVSGATEGGAALVVQPSIHSPGDLRGKKVASPQLGNTQDVALRTWLKEHRLRTNLQGGGDVSVVPQENAQSLDTFRLGEIAGAWLPEPWATRLIEEAEAKVLVDESTLWPGGRFPTTVLVVRADFLREHPGLVRRLLRAHVRAVDLLSSEREASLQAVNKMIAREIGKALPGPILGPAARNLRFTTDVDPAAFRTLATRAKSLGLLKHAGLTGAFELGPLEQVRSAVYGGDPDGR